MKQANQIAHFRQLCALGVQAHTLMPTALQALHALIGSDHNAFFWSGDSGDIENAYFEAPMPPAVAQVYFGQYVNDRARGESTVNVRDRLPAGKTVGNSATLFSADFYRSGMYHDVWRPLNRRHVLWARVTDGRARRHGIALYRGPADAPFDARDEATLAQIVPYLGRAIAAPAREDEAYVASPETGLLIADAQAGVRHLSDDARRLLVLAGEDHVSRRASWAGPTLLPAAASELCRRLAARELATAQREPTAQTQNRWGRFVFRAHRLGGGGDGALIGMTIQRWVPRRLMLLQGARDLPLSAKQREVALMLAEGTPHRAIAIELGISLHTVADHARKICDKLEVSGGAGLRAKLASSSMQ